MAHFEKRDDFLSRKVRIFYLNNGFFFRRIEKKSYTIFRNKMFTDECELTGNNHLLQLSSLPKQLSMRADSCRRCCV